jgi:hypothetical protein
MLFSELIQLGHLRLRIGPYGAQMIFHFGQGFFTLCYLAFERAEQISDSAVLLLIDEGDGLEGVGFMLTEHFALAAGRPAAVLAEVVQTYPVFPALLKLLLLLEEPSDDGLQLVKEAGAVDELRPDGLPAVGALGL